MQESFAPETMGVMLPSNIEAERAVLGSLLLDQELLADIQAILKPADFTVPAHQTIYQAMLGAAEQGKPLEMALLRDILEVMGRLEDVGGVAYLASLEQYVATSASGPDFAKRVAEKSRLRRLIHAVQGIMRESSTEQDAKGRPLDTSQILDRAEKAVFEIGQETLQGDFKTSSELAAETMDRIEMLYHRKAEVSGLRTFFADLDTFTTGFHASEFIIIAARPSGGKTAFAVNIAVQVAKGGKIQGQRLQDPLPVGFFSLEMSASELTQRILGSIGKVSSRRIRSGHLSPDELHKVTEASHQLASWPLYIDDSPGLTPMALRAKARRLKAREPRLSLIMVDYLQLMHGAEGGRQQENRQQEVAEISRSLKLLAREIETPVVALSQLSRSIEQRSGRGRPGRPQLSDLRESGSLEQDADVVLFVQRERNPTDKAEDGQPRLQMAPEPAEIIIAKQRNGPITSFPLLFVPEITVFYDAARQ